MYKFKNEIKMLIKINNKLKYKNKLIQYIGIIWGI